MSEGSAPAASGSSVYNDKSKPQQVRLSNISAAKAVADAVRTSLGPKGMDKMIQSSRGDVTITNDGATILSLMQVLHPAARMLVELSKAQDIEAGDGTTSVVVICGALLAAAELLLNKGIHPSVVSDAFQKASEKSVQILEAISTPVELSDRDALLKSATTSLNSKVVSLYSATIAPIVVDAVLKVADPSTHNVDLRDIKIIKRLDGTVEETELVDGVVFNNSFAQSTGTAGRIEKAKIALVQFCLSAPKTDLDNQVIVSDYSQMDRVLREERQYILDMCKQIKKSGCNVILIQKSILRDAVSDLALHFLEKMKIAVVKNIERDEVELICKSLGCRPIAHIDNFTAEMMGHAELVEEVSAGNSKFIKFTGTNAKARTCSIVVRGTGQLVVDEAERSIHDALCVIRCLVKKRAVLAGGGSPEIELALRLTEYSNTLDGVDAFCIRAYAEALEVIPFTLAENAGLNPISTVTELRSRHKAGGVTMGINVRKGAITDILEENVVQPLLVTTSAITLASETVRSIMKIDDIVNTR